MACGILFLNFAGWVYFKAVSWLTDRNWFMAAVILYGIAMLHSVFLWRKGFRQHDRISTGLLLAGFIFHTRAMFLRGMTLQHCPVNNFYEAITFVIWTIVATILLASVFPRLRFLGAFAAPILFAMGVFALVPGLDPPHVDKPVFNESLRSLHASFSLLSYGAFGLGAVAGAMFLTQEHDLKFQKLRAIFSLLPSMERLEKTMVRLSFVGWALLTFGLVLSPALLLHNPPDSAHGRVDPKVPWAMVVWAAYFVLLLRHKWFGQAGRRFAWGVIGLFAFVLLTFWGINSVSPAHQL